MSTLARIAAAAAGAVVLTAGSIEAQSLAERASAVRNGTVRFSYEAKEGVCGNGRNISVQSNRDTEWESDCEAGPVRIVMEMQDGRPRDVETRVGGRWRTGTGATDLGMVPPDEAARYLLGAAERMSDGGSALFAATLARGVTVWPDLLRIARNEDLGPETRKSAIFWLGSAAGDVVTASLDSVVMDDGDREVRQAAIFALSRRPADEGVPALIRVARTNPDPELRRNAMFWLGRSEDPRALELFEEVLVEGR